MSKRQEETDYALGELSQDLVQRPIAMSDCAKHSEIQVPDTMEFSEFLEEFGGDTFVEAFHGMMADS